MVTLCDSEGKEFACNAGNQGSIPGLGKFPGEGNGNQLQYSCLENPMDKGAWQSTVRYNWAINTFHLATVKINTQLKAEFYGG